jgi:glycine/D-amino acid oxidase-like deaminating enzyme
LRIAQFLKEELGVGDIVIIEKEPEVMLRASYNNQARVHNGYHYPRSVLTALRSRVNLPIFSKEYEAAMVKDFVKYYAVATNFSKVSARQFLRFYQRIDAEITPSDEGMEYFNPKLIDRVFKVREYAFNARILKKILLRKLDRPGVTIHTDEKVNRIYKNGTAISVLTDKAEYQADYVLNTTYSSINAVNRNSGLPIIPFKHELTEMCLVKVPEEFDKKAFTIMCGPFFSLMPFPDKELYTLSHVRYTPHSEWYDTDGQVRDPHAYLDEIKKVSHFPQMIADIKRYMPLAGKIAYSGKSLWEIKTVLPQSEADDSRPILYKSHHGGVRNYICIMGGKIDNIYDVFRELKQTYEQTT